MVAMLFLALVLGSGGSPHQLAQAGSPNAQAQGKLKDDGIASDHEEESWRKLKHTLPRRAKISIGKAHLIPGDTDHETSEECSAWHLTEHQVRRMFHTYHVVIGVDHELYSEVGCAIDGDILVDDRRYTFTAQQINNLYTNWPNGKSHRLGGKP